jgi:hypothetical protein
MPSDCRDVFCDVACGWRPSRRLERGGMVSPERRGGRAAGGFATPPARVQAGAPGSYKSSTMPCAPLTAEAVRP